MTRAVIAIADQVIVQELRSRLDEADAEGLVEAWRFASRARNATVQVRGKPSDQLPRDARERAAVASVLGYPAGSSDQMVNDYLRAARRARGIVDRIFWE